MHVPQQIKYHQGIATLSRPIVPSRTTVALPPGHTQTKGVATQGVSVPDLILDPVVRQPILPEDQEENLLLLADLMVATVRKFSGSIETWTFNASDSLHDLILKCTFRLRERAQIDHVDVLADGKGLRLIMKRFIGNRSTVFCIPLKPVFGLRHRNGKLYHILLSFLKELPFINLFHTGESRVDWLWEYLFEEEMYLKKEGRKLPKDHSVRFFGRHEKVFSDYDPRDWRKLLREYRPRKPLHIQLKKLLEQADALDFKAPFRVWLHDEYECMFEHWESYLLVDNVESEFTTNYIQMLNECSNEYDITSAFEHTTVEKDAIKPFEKGLVHKLNQVDDFLEELNELLRQL